MFRQPLISGRKVSQCLLFGMLLAVTVFSLILAEASLAQMDMSQYLEAGSNFTGYTGLTMIDSTPFYRIALAPNLDLGKIGVGLDLVFLYNPDEGFRAEDGEQWDSVSDYLRAIRYVRYGHLRDPIYARYGSLDHVSFGYGLLMDGYSNYDRRGVRVQLNQRFTGVDLLLNNIAEPELYGARAYVRPLVGLEMPLLHRLEVGATYLVDSNPDPLIDDEENFLVYGLDTSLPILQNRLLFLGLYDQLGFMKQPEPDAETTRGNAVGVRAELMDAVLKVEYRTLGENYQPVPFDYTYEYRKRQMGFEPYRSESVTGIFGDFWYTLLGKFLIRAAYEDYSAEGPLGEPRLFATLVADDVMEKVSFRGLYTKRGIEDFGDMFDLDEKSALTLFLGYEFMSPLQIVFVHEFRFRRMDDEEGYETIHKTSVQLGASMNF